MQHKLAQLEQSAAVSLLTVSLISYTVYICILISLVHSEKLCFLNLPEQVNDTTQTRLFHERVWLFQTTFTLCWRREVISTLGFTCVSHLVAQK